MKSLYILLVPVLITVVALGVHRLFGLIQYRKELKKDKAKEIRLNELLGVDLQDWYNKEYS